MSESATNPANTVNSSLIQHHVYKMALLSAQVYDLIRYATCFSTYELEQLSAKLETWHQELPESLHLRSLTVSDSTASASARRPLLFMHMVYITAQITLYERALYANQTISTSDGSVAFHLSEDTHQIYGSFAQQLARIVGLLYEEENILRRCWLTM